MAREAADWAGASVGIAFLALILAGCASSAPDRLGSSAGRGIGNYRVGAPYEIKGVWYYPAVDYNYDRTGVASWYGEEFEGRLTANGEIFDLNGMTAAHTTLPMPSIVQVTNLANGRSIRLRVNDRGPFVDGRLIDVSRRAAQLLGFETRGTALVRVTILKDQSIAVAEEAMRSSGQILVAQTSTAAEPPPAPAPLDSVAATSGSMARDLAPLPAEAAFEQRAVRPPSQNAAMPGGPSPALARLTAPSSISRPSSPPSVPALSPGSPMQLATASSPAPPMLPPGAPPRTVPSPRYRFALISPAEAAELPSAQSPTRKPDFVAGSAPAPVAKMPPSTPKAAITVKQPAGGIYVQAGAFAQRNNAERVESRIAQLGRVQVTAASVNGVAMYRVRLGPFKNAEQASRLLARVVDSGFPGARIVGD
jgi:rare lipoprotein A